MASGLKNSPTDNNLPSISNMARVVVVGTSGSGKTTFAKELAELQATNYVQLDELHWGPDWTPKPERDFVYSIKTAVAGQRWVIDGNYSRHRELIWSRATHVIWLDFSFPRVMYQLFLRTLRRSLLREELYAGNRETLSKAFFRRDSILLWGLTTYHRRRKEYSQIIDDQRFPNIEFVRLSSPGETEAFLKRTLS